MKKLSNTKLILRYDKREQDIILSWPKSKADAHLVMGTICGILDDGLLAELERRGYDRTTIRFEIALKDPAL